MSSIQVVGALFERLGPNQSRQILIFRRGPHVRNPGEWEFPGGKVEPQESKEAALRREIKEELGLDINVISSLGDVDVFKNSTLITLTVYRCEIAAGTMCLSEHDATEWVEPDELDLSRLSEPDRPFIERYLKAVATF